MKTLQNNVILYDSNCPMCKAYTGSFVACGLLDKNSRIPYNEKDPFIFSWIDANRARNEIALLDAQTKQVRYGIDSLIHIVSHNRKWLNTVLNFAPVYYPVKFLYAFISYNRKLIAPSAEKNDACTPSFSWFFRVLYFLLTGLLTGYLLYAFTKPVLEQIGYNGSITREMGIVGGQLIFQTGVLYCMGYARKMDYLGNMMTVSFMGALMLLIPMTIRTYYTMDLLFHGIWFAAIVSTMLILHLRRSKKLGLGLGISLSWIAYRMLVVALFIFLL